MAFIGEGKNTFRAFIAKTEGNRSLGKPKLRWRIILKLILKKLEGVGCGLD